MILILRNSTKSIQLILNETVKYLPKDIMSISNSAYSKARKKIAHTAFIALNQLTVDVMYTEQYKTYCGKRILAVDGSKIRLPDTPEMIKEFGSHPYRNTVVEGENAFALASVLYDTQNNIALEALLTPTDTSEKSLAIEHLKHVQENDLIIYDRGYGSYELIARIQQTKGDFLIRLSTQSFKHAKEMFKSDGITDQIVTIKPGSKVRDKKRKGLLTDLPESITVRFVRVELGAGEIEVLVTSLFDQETFSPEVIKELYWKRWGVETFYGILKTRLQLENFTGTSVESVKQDFYAAIFLTGLETVMTQDVERDLQQKEVEYIQKVNKAVAFNAIKEYAFDLLLNTRDPQETIVQLEKLFLTNPTLYRPERSFPRICVSPQKIVHYLKRKCKGVF